MEVTAQSTRQDYAKIVRWLVDEVYPHVEYIRLVQDNLNTHTSASLYETFLPAEARRILQRVEVHYMRHPRELVEYGRDRDRYSRMQLWEAGNSSARCEVREEEKCQPVDADFTRLSRYTHSYWRGSSFCPQ